MKKIYYEDKRTRVTNEVVSDDVTRLIIPLNTIISAGTTRLFPFWRSKLEVTTTDGNKRLTLRTGCFTMNLLRDIAEAIADAVNDASERERNTDVIDKASVRRLRVGERLRESGEEPPPEVMEMFEKK